MRHSADVLFRFLNARLLGVGLLGLYVSACGAAADTASEGVDLGGQTGSLIPTCLIGGGAPAVIPEGDTAFAQQVSSPFGDATLTDPVGNDVPLTETREGDTSILRTDQTLLPGTYTLTEQCDALVGPITREISVVEAAPLPQTFGTLVPTPLEPPPFCNDLSHVRFTWTPASDFLPFLALTTLTLRQGDSDLGVIALAEPLAVDGEGNTLLIVPLCPATDTCVPGKGEYSLKAHVASETGTWASEVFDVDPQCRREPIDDEFSSCVVAPARSREVNASPVWLLLTLSLWLTRRRGA